jgi:zinc protease
VREELGQAYTTNCRYSPDLDSGTFVLYVLTTPEKVDSVKAVVMQELKNLRTQELSAADLEGVKSYLKGGKVRSLATNSALGATATSDEINGLGYLYYEKFNARLDAVTAMDIKRIANQYLDVSKAALVITRPKAGSQHHE